MTSIRKEKVLKEKVKHIALVSAMGILRDAGHVR